jgi:hypothetical protein
MNLACTGMSGPCQNPASHIDNKGYLYCTQCGRKRRTSGTPTRKLSAAESDRLSRGETISYARKTRR